MEALRAWDKIFSFRSVTVFVLFHSDWTHQLSYCVNRIPRWKGCGHSPLNMYAVGSKGTWWLSVGGSASLKNTAGVCGQDLQVLLTKLLLCYFLTTLLVMSTPKPLPLIQMECSRFAAFLKLPARSFFLVQFYNLGLKLPGRRLVVSAVYWKYHLIPAALSGPSFPSFHSEDMLT